MSLSRSLVSLFSLGSLGSLVSVVGLASTMVGCAAHHATETEESEVAADSRDPLTGITGVERGIHFEGVVHVDPSASDAQIAVAVAREVKTAIGALRTPKVALDDRAARTNVDPSKWKKRILRVVDPKTGAAVSSVLEVTFRYDDRAVVTHGLDGKSAVDFVVLADDYATHADGLKASCSDDATTDADSLWYHYTPQLAACRTSIQAELTAITAEKTALAKQTDAIGPKEAARFFLPITAKLDAPKLPAAAAKLSPEYDRLFGVGSDKSQVVVYAFFGVDSDEQNPDDVLAQEAARFLRELLRAQPNFRPVRTDPFTWLLDFNVGGKKVEDVTYDRMLGWIVDQTNFPAEATDAALKLDLRKQAIGKLAERWIYWDLPITVNGAQKTVEVRTFYGYEDAAPDARQHAQWRYLEALWYGDVFLYNGHSHFGHGPLEPTLYGPQNFNDRYQIMLVNSCISYNYYHQDFFEKKPGGTANLDMVVNGLPSYVWGGGLVTARFLSGLISGTQPTYADLLGSMRLDTPWGEKGYDPMRVADGELDNAFSQAKTPLTLTVGAPVYP